MSAARFNPFPGLRSFETAEKHLFFGREAQTAEMLQRLGTTRFLAAVGPSGSGKSSLVRAGLVPELLGGANLRAGSHWVVLVFRPGGDPMAALAKALAESELYEGEWEDAPAQVETTVARSARGLVEAVRQAKPPVGTNVLVVVDQFEELFRFASARRSQQDVADAFVNLLLEASRETSVSIYVVLTMRSDFIGDCARFPGLAEAINQGQYLIPRLTRDQWRLAIEGPVRVGGGAIAPRLVQRLLSDVADDPDQLPVLQHALMRTWDYWARTETAANPPPIDLKHYEATEVGGMAEALSRHADEALLELPTVGHHRLAERVFKALTEKGADGRGIRRPARFDALQSALGAAEGELKIVLDAFRKPGRTFVLPGTEVELKPPTVLDISHESLMRVWTRLRTWVEEEAESAATYRRLAETAELWKRGKSGLYRDPELALALRWRHTNQPTEGWGKLQRGEFATALRFLEESEEAARREREEKEAAQRRELERAQAEARAQRRRASLFALVAVAMAALVVVVFLSLLRIDRLRKEAAAREREAVSRELAARAVNQLNVDPELSVLLAREAMRTSSNLVAEETLREALFASHVRFRLGKEGDPSVRVVEYSPDGARVITAGAGVNAGLWDARTGQAVAVLAGHSAGINTARFSSTGLAVTASNDGTARVWNAADGRLLQVLAADTNAVRSAEFSRDGAQILAASEDGTARLWSGNNWTNLIVLPSQGGRANGAVFSPNGEQAIVFGDDGSSRLWKLRPQPVALALTNEANPRDLISAGYSPTGELFATAAASGDRQIDVWNAATGKTVEFYEPSDTDELRPGTDERLTAEALEFAHERNYLVSAYGRIARVWIPTNRVQFTILRGHEETVLSAAFSPDDAFVLTSGADRTARLWTPSRGRELRIFRGHGRQVNRARFSPEEGMIATASDDGTARLWSMGTGEAADTLPMSIAGAAFSIDGAQAAVIGLDDPKVSLWRTFGPAISIALETNATRFALSGDGQKLALFTELGGIQLWSLPTNTLTVLPVEDAPLTDPALNRDGSLLFWTGTNQGAQLWKLQPRPEQVRVSDPGWSWTQTASDPAVFSPQGGWLALVSQHTNIVVYSLGSESAPSPRLHRRLARSHEIKRLAFAPDGQHLAAVGDDGVVRGWNLAATNRADPLWQLTHEASVTDARFSPDNRFVVTACVDGAARVWSAITGRLLAKLMGNSQPLVGAAFTPGSKSVVTVNSDGEVRTFSAEPCLPANQLLELARRRVTRELTAAELK